MLNNSLWDHRGIVSPCYYGVAALVGPKLAHDLQKVPTIDGAVRSSAVLPQQSPSMILNNTVFGAETQGVLKVIIDVTTLSRCELCDRGPMRPSRRIKTGNTYNTRAAAVCQKYTMTMSLSSSPRLINTAKLPWPCHPLTSCDEFVMSITTVSIPWPRSWPRS